MLVNASSWTPFIGPTSFSYSSAPVPLTANQTVLLELAHCNTVGSGFAKVGVTVPNTTPQPFSIPDIQQINVTVARAQMVQSIRVLYGSTSFAGFNITISGNASYLSDPTVGVQVDYLRTLDVGAHVKMLSG